MSKREEITNKLQKEAKDLLNNKSLWSPFISSGKIHVTGSAYLDLLVYPDLDVYYEIFDPKINIIDIFAEAARYFIGMKEVSSLKLEKELNKKYPNKVPEGIFFQYKINNGKHLWKVDIWAIADRKVLEKKMKELKNFKEKMNEDQRKLILLTKHQLAKPFGRTPVFSSYLVYKAVLEEGINDVDQIIAYIRNQGGNVDRLK